MNKVYLICGSTGSGKTTFCHDLLKNRSAIVFSIDEWMADLFFADMSSKSDFTWVLERVTRCETVIWKQCLKLQQLGVEVILDMGFSTVEKRQAYYRLLSEAGIPYEVFYLDVPKELRWSRVSHRNEVKDKTFKFEVTEAMFSYIESIFEAPSTEELAMNNGHRLSITT